MPFLCDNYPATAIFSMKDKYGEFKSMIVLQDRNQFVFDIYTNCIEWNVERLIWIAFYKNSDNTKYNYNDCLFAGLPKDLIKCIIYLVGRSVMDKSRVFIKI